MGEKERITITIDRELLEWLDLMVSQKVFSNRSHALEFLVRRSGELENEAKNYSYFR